MIETQTKLNQNEILAQPLSEETLLNNQTLVDQYLTDATDKLDKLLDDLLKNKIFGKSNFDGINVTSRNNNEVVVYLNDKGSVFCKVSFLKDGVNWKVHPVYLESDQHTNENGETKIVEDMASFKLLMNELLAYLN